MNNLKEFHLLCNSHWFRKSLFGVIAFSEVKILKRFMVFKISILKLPLAITG